MGGDVRKEATFQDGVGLWMLACFGESISSDVAERNHRFIEEALELVQASGCTRSECVQLVDYVYSRPPGEPTQEVGGVLVTLAALCLARKIDMNECGEAELSRVWTKVDRIREKQANKPKNSPLPEIVVAGASSELDRLTAEVAALKAEDERVMRRLRWLSGNRPGRICSIIATESIGLYDRLKAENAALKVELEKACSRNGLTRCKGCGDYVTELADDALVYCWGCQDDIDDNGEINEEYRMDEKGKA